LSDNEDGSALPKALDVGIDAGCVLAAPEPSALWLMLVGSLLLSRMKVLKRWPARTLKNDGRIRLERLPFRVSMTRW